MEDKKEIPLNPSSILNADGSPVSGPYKMGICHTSKEKKEMKKVQETLFFLATQYVNVCKKKLPQKEKDAKKLAEMGKAKDAKVKKFRKRLAGEKEEESDDN